MAAAERPARLRIDSLSDRGKSIVKSSLDLIRQRALGRVDHAFAPGEKQMQFDASLDSEQLSMLAAVLDDYCDKAGIPQDHPARVHFGRRLLSLFQSGVTEPARLTAKMNSGYEEWLGEIGATGHFKPPKLSSGDQLKGDNILPGSDRRGRPPLKARGFSH